MTTDKAFLDHFRCPDRFADFGVDGILSKEAGFFQFGENTVCYGQCSCGSPSKHITQHLPDASQAVSLEKDQVRLAFDLTQIVENLRLERYNQDSSRPLQKVTEGSISRKVYYFVRPLLPVSVRKHLQRARLNGWDQIPFPHWPVDFTVESLMERAMTLVLKSRQVKRIPFIWFWPEGAASCAIMTHDVEAVAGRDFCGQLMDMDESFGIKSSFQIVPEDRYEPSASFLENFRRRGFELNVHDLNHDGTLFQEKEKFLESAKQINRYAKEFGASGFRAGAMYRNQNWFETFSFSYDMSVPNVAHLEPQRGGCCTVMPYFIGDIIELPLTAAQDYSLFHILGEYSIDLWKQQIQSISEKNGLISFITHPDYLIEPRAQAAYRDLLAHLAKLRAEEKLWIPLPRDVNDWWRKRSQMKLIREGDTWRIEGSDANRARIAYATLGGDRLVYSLDAPS